MTLLRRCFFACCIAFAAGAFAQAQTPAGEAQRTASLSQTSLEGRKARLALLSPISSKSPSGSSFMAKLEDPVEMDGKPVLQPGTLVEGHLETVPARRMMRRGAMRLIFDRIKLPDSTVQPARFELSSSDSNSAKTDSEGTLHPTVSKTRLALQLGGTSLVAKLADDLSEEALATTAGSARWYGLAASTAFLLLQKGREVKLKPGDVIVVDLMRDSSELPTNPPGNRP
ncbi:MAG TPA: hypothetical protein VEU11_09515 [Terriglobales bacterium]|nr:hypothetical protein [Terriglobales bacterium]